MENWLRDNGLKETGALEQLEPVRQICQLLQARKRAESNEDADAALEVSSRLTLAQVTKLLNLYAPVNDYEERVPVAFIRRVHERSKARFRTQTSLAGAATTDPADAAEMAEQNTLLMNTKPTFPVTFTFKPSKVYFETVAVPTECQLSFLKRI